MTSEGYLLVGYSRHAILSILVLQDLLYPSRKPKVTWSEIIKTFPKGIAYKAVPEKHRGETRLAIGKFFDRNTNYRSIVLSSVYPFLCYLCTILFHSFFFSLGIILDILLLSTKISPTSNSSSTFTRCFKSSSSIKYL